MEQRHPHTDAVYKVVRQQDSTFGVEVMIPDSYKTIITSFPTEADADAWVVEHKRKAVGGNSLKRRYIPGFAGSQ